MSPKPSKGNILIIDDTPANLNLLSSILKNHGYYTRPAPNGQFALSAAQGDPPDLILLDVKMPKMDGYEVCKRLKANEQTQAIPIIFISALSEVEDKVKGFTAGGVDYIIKPFQEEEVLARVKTHLALKAAIQAKDESNAMLTAVLQSIPDTIVAVDQQLQIVSVNGTQGSDLASQTLTVEQAQTMLENCEGVCRTVLTQTLQTQTPVHEYRGQCACGLGQSRMMVWNTTPLETHDNHFSGAVMVMRDITRLTELENKLLIRHSFRNIISKNTQMHNLFTLIEQMADLDMIVLVTGASGTGKELIADAIHQTSRRANQPFIKVNCAALSENLLESELFGHVRGAFTGAVNDRIGRFQAAEKGTLFLDEIGEISMPFQAKLLRILEQKEYERIGETKTRKADVRIIAATNRDLLKKVQAGEFREDLFYRLRGVHIQLPPLEERTEDIPLLINHFVQRFQESTHRNIEGVSDEVMKIFLNHPWPGNIRELKNTIESACALCLGGTVELTHLPPEMIQPVHLSRPQAKTPTQRSEKETILQVLDQTDGNKAKAARLLGMSRGTLYNKLLKYGIESASD